MGILERVGWRNAPRFGALRDHLLAEAHVQQHHVVKFLLQGLEGLLTAGYAGGVQLALFKAFDDGFQEVDLIVNHQNPEVMHGLLSLSEQWLLNIAQHR